MTDRSKWQKSESLNKEDQLCGSSLKDVLFEMKLVGMWEKSGDHYRCRYYWAWRDLGDGRIAGYFGGYSGGGSFSYEEFFARFEDGEPVCFIYDQEDRVTGSEEDVWDVLRKEGTAAQEAAEHGSVLSKLWHDVEAMEDEQWYLDPAMKKCLRRSHDMLIMERKDDLDIVRKLKNFAPMNAGPK